MSSDNVIALNPVSPPSPDSPICKVSYKATPLLELYRFTDWYPREYVVIPDYLLKPAERELAARTFKPKDDEEARIFAEVRTQIKNRTQGYAARREIEAQIAEYLDLNRLYPEVVAKLRKCRQSGCYGYRKNERGENEPIMAWDKKCNLVRLCPDESR